MARDTSDARHRPILLRPQHWLGEAPADVLNQLQAGAWAHGHATWSAAWRCTACGHIWRWQDLIAAEAEGTTRWLPLCPTADCAGIGWLYLQSA